MGPLVGACSFAATGGVEYRYDNKDSYYYKNSDGST
jgi:hypothetical protein